MKTYRIDTVEGVKVIICLKCGLTSYHPFDIREKYCCSCHTFHEEKSWDDHGAHMTSALIMEKAEKIKKLCKEILE